MALGTQHPALGARDPTSCTRPPTPDAQPGHTAQRDTRPLSYTHAYTHMHTHTRMHTHTHAHTCAHKPWCGLKPLSLICWRCPTFSPLQAAGRPALTSTPRRLVGARVHVGKPSLQDVQTWRVMCHNSPNYDDHVSFHDAHYDSQVRHNHHNP